MNHLITTRLDKTESDNVIYLGPWCVPECDFEKNRSRMAPSWYNRDKLSAATKYCRDMYESLLVEIADNLNHIHSLNQDTSYWRIVIGPWLQNFIEMLYDRYHSIKILKDSGVSFTTLLLSETSYFIPCDMNDYADRIADDHYNWQIYSRLFRLMGFKFSEQILPPENNTYPVYRLKDKIRQFVRNFRLKWKSSQIVTYLSYTPGAIFSELGVSVSEFLSPKKIKARNSFNTHVRSALLKNFNPTDEFQLYVKLIVPYEIPMSMIEDFNDLRQSVVRNVITPRLIVSSVGWYWPPSDLFKIFAAEMQKRGALLIGLQHGGNYGIVKDVQTEQHERSIADFFFTWGWKPKNEVGVKIFDMPANILLGRKKYTLGSSGILYVPGANNRYLFRLEYQSTPYERESYFKSHCDFYQNLSENNKRIFRYRPFIDKNYWNTEDRIKERFPEMIVEDYRVVPFAQSIEESKVQVVDAFSTTYIEGLSLGKPTIMIVTKDLYEYTEEFTGALEVLRESGILFHDPVVAADFLNTNYETIDAWWHNRKRQNLIYKFCQSYGRHQDDGIDVWKNELINILSNKRTDA